MQGNNHSKTRNHKYEEVKYPIELNDHAEIHKIVTNEMELDEQFNTQTRYLYHPNIILTRIIAE